MNFRISGLSPEPFRHLYGLSDEALSVQGVKRYVADKRPGFPIASGCVTSKSASAFCCSTTSASPRTRPIARRTRFSSKRARKRSTTASAKSRRS